MSQPDPNGELRHLIRSAKEEVAALDARFDRLDIRLNRIEQVAIDQRTDADHIRVTLDGHTATLAEHGELLREILRRLPERGEA